MSTSIMITAEDIGERTATIVRSQEPVCLREVPLGKEYAFEGRVYQASMVPSAFGRTVAGNRFRYGDVWFMRLDDTNHANLLDPNAPFGKPSKGTKLFDAQLRIGLLEIVDRGLA